MFLGSFVLRVQSSLPISITKVWALGKQDIRAIAWVTSYSSPYLGNI